MKVTDQRCQNCNGIVAAFPRRLHMKYPKVALVQRTKGGTLDSGLGTQRSGRSRSLGLLG